MRRLFRRARRVCGPRRVWRVNLRQRRSRGLANPDFPWEGARVASPWVSPNVQFANAIQQPERTLRTSSKRDRRMQLTSARHLHVSFFVFPKPSAVLEKRSSPSHSSLAFKLFKWRTRSALASRSSFLAFRRRRFPVPICIHIFAPRRTSPAIVAREQHDDESN